ncbi:amidohydrolase family protein [Hwangdonia sp.]|uniref:amidohydrolase family protein n=1 Tax=Hwangdonia sp. TaxID=1883432 RepID=UPI003AB77EEE
MNSLKLYLGAILILACTYTESQTNEIGNANTAYHGPKIDMHAHAFEKMFFGGVDYENPLTGKKHIASSSIEKQREETFQQYKKHQVVKAMVSQGELWKSYAPDLVLIGNNHKNSIEELRKRHAEGNLDVLAEIAPSYDGLLPSDESLEPYYDLAEELNIPMGYHMYPGGPPGGAYFAYPKTRAHQGKPLQFEDILLAHPKMKFFIMHAGWPYLEDMKALMYAHPQVYVEVGVIAWALPRKEFHNFLKGLIDAGQGKKIMFGTDQMIWPETITDCVEAINSAEFLTLEQKADIFYNNAAEFLGLSEEEIKKHKTDY